MNLKKLFIILLILILPYFTSLKSFNIIFGKNNLRQMILKLNSSINSPELIFDSDKLLIDIIDYIKHNNNILKNSSPFRNFLANSIPKLYTANIFEQDLIKENFENSIDKIKENIEKNKLKFFPETIKVKKIKPKKFENGIKLNKEEGKLLFDRIDKLSKLISEFYPTIGKYDSDRQYAIKGILSALNSKKTKKDLTFNDIDIIDMLNEFLINLKGKGGFQFAFNKFFEKIRKNPVIAQELYDYFKELIDKYNLLYLK